MNKLMYVAALAALPLVAACTKSVDRAQRDVQRAHDQAAQNVQRKEQDLEDTKREAAARIAQKERRVQDAARQGNDKVIKEERQLDDAVRADVRRNETSDTTVTPAPTERAPVRTEAPARVDVNINRQPGSGVQVDVHKNP